MLRATCLTLAIATGIVAPGIFACGATPALAQQSPAPEYQVHDVQAARSVTLIHEAPELHAMLEAMGTYDVIAIMGTEHTRGAVDIEAQMFPGAGGDAWQAMVTRLHANDRIVGLFEAAIDRDAMTPDQIAQVTAFMHSDEGRGIIAGEVAAHRLFLDETALEDANAAFRAAVQSGDPRMDILQRLIEVNGLIERNVSGALNQRFAFYSGLMDGGAFGADMAEDRMLTEIWTQEPEVRRMTIEWLYSFQLAAYGQVSDADLEAYIALLQTDAGRAVNALLFATFDEVMTTLSYDLGTAAAIFVVGEDT